MFSVSGTQIEDVEVIDLRDCFSLLKLFSSAGADGSEGGSGDGGDEGGDGGEQGKEGTEGGNGDGSGDGSDDESEIKDPEKKKLSDEAAKHRREAREAQKERDEAKAALKKIEDAKKDDLKRVTDDLEETNGKLTNLQEENTELKLRLAIFETPGLQEFADPSAALALMNRKVILGEDGELDTDGLKREIKRLKDGKSLRMKSEDDGDEGSQQQRSGGPNNGRKSTEADRAALEKKFPALAGRG